MLSSPLKLCLVTVPSILAVKTLSGFSMSNLRHWMEPPGPRPWIIDLKSVLLFSRSEVLWLVSQRMMSPPCRYKGQTLMFYTGVNILIGIFEMC